MGWASALAAASTVFSTVGAYRNSQSAKAAYEYQAEVARNNATVNEWKAQDAITRGQTDEANRRMQTAQLKGRQRAAMAARGVDLGEGSALNILTDTDYMGEIDALTIRDNANREAWAFRSAGANDTANAGLLSTRASNESPGREAFTSLISSASKVAAGGK